MNQTLHFETTTSETGLDVGPWVCLLLLFFLPEHVCDICCKVCLSRAGLACYMRSHNNKQSLADMQFLPQQPINNTGQQQICSLRFLADLGRIRLVLLNQVKFVSYGHMFFTFLSTCTHVWSILEEVGGGKMPCRKIVLIGNDYFHDKKYSGPIVLGDYVEKGSV